MAVPWFEWSWHKVLVGEPACGIKISFFLFFLQFIINTFFMDSFNSFYNSISNLNLEMFSIDEFFLILCFYNFFKLLSVSILMELLWPTHFFNRKNTILFKFVRKRSFLEFLLYLFRPFYRNIVANKFFIRYVFIRRFR